MTKHLQEDDVIRFLETVNGYLEPGDRNNIDAVLSISSSVNFDVFENVKRKEGTMSDALRLLMKEEFQEAERNASDKSLIYAIKSLMKKQDLDADKAMELMDIPPADQVRYAAMLSS